MIRNQIWEIVQPNFIPVDVVHGMEKIADLAAGVQYDAMHGDVPSWVVGMMLVDVS